MSLSFVAFASCSDDDKDESTNSNGNTQTENDNGSNNNSGSQTAVIVGTENGHEWVDLGLTSGTKWATCNVGADKPEEYGNYYAWGETTTKSTYNWNTYKYGTYNYDEDYSTLTKYNLSDNKTTLDLSDDAAYVNWGGKWRMPTVDQWNELENQCYWVWTNSYNGSNIAGWIVSKAKSSSDKGLKIYDGETPSSSYSLNDAHIFLPAAGSRNDGDLDGIGAEGYYWSSSRNAIKPSDSWYVYFCSNYVDYGDYRSSGQSVRAVISGE